MSQVVTTPEANLLWLARAAVEDGPAPRLARLVELKSEPPRRLGPTARALLSETLSVGVVLALARFGGWRAEPGGRLWERRSPPPLQFTVNLVQLLQWMLATPLLDDGPPSLVLPHPLTPAEEAFVVLLASRPDAARWRPALCRQVALRRSPLFLLAFAADVGRERVLDAVPAFDVAALGTFVEGLSDLLATQWVEATRGLCTTESAAPVRRAGEAQAAVLTGWLSACQAAGRRDLADFIIEAGARLTGPGRWSWPHLDSSSLRERTEARRAAVAFFRALGLLRAWDQEHRAVRFIDDGYAQAQALVKRWERLGAAGFDTAARLVAEADGL